MFLEHGKDTQQTSEDIVHPVVTICVDSPDDEEKCLTPKTPEVERVIMERTAVMNIGDNQESENNSQENEPIDVNLASTCDTSKIFYDY